ncbi:hypothetical protein LCGC14_1816590, partial [marine sediment metagenome]
MCTLDDTTLVLAHGQLGCDTRTVWLRQLAPLDLPL